MHILKEADSGIEWTIVTVATSTLKNLKRSNFLEQKATHACAQQDLRALKKAYVNQLE